MASAALTAAPPSTHSVQLDRGRDLNQRRLRGEMVDVTFSVGERAFPAHRLIVSLYSPYLRTLVATSEGFVEAGRSEFELRDVDGEVFGLLLSYMYTGAIEVGMDTVFDVMELCQYLQLQVGFT